MKNAVEDLKNLIDRKETYLEGLKPDQQKTARALQIEIDVLLNCLEYIEAFTTEQYKNNQAYIRKINQLDREKATLEAILLQHGVIDFYSLAVRGFEYNADELMDLLQEHSFIMPFGLRPHFAPEAICDKSTIDEFFNENLRINNLQPKNF